MAFPPDPRLLRAGVAMLAFVIGVRVCAAAEWVRVETPNFVVFGESGERRTREIAAEFERFREALGRVTVAPGKSAVPTVIVVFDTQSSFREYRPRYNGKIIDVAGYYIGTEAQSVIALTIQDRDNALRTIFHEYSHLMLADLLRGIPTWVNEGLAEYYSTFPVLGGRIPSHSYLLGGTALMPLDELITVDDSSPLYNEGNRRSLFYAQSWALVHMLLSAEPSRYDDLRAYIGLTTAGEPSAAAWRKVFGTKDIIPDLRSYVERGRMTAFRFREVGKIETSVGPASRVSPSDVQALLGDLLRFTHPEGARAHLEAAAAMQPPSPLSRAVLGLVKIRDSEDEAARILLTAAAAERRDWLVQYHVGVGFASLARGGSSIATDAEAAQAALDAVLAARPDLAHAYAVQAMLPSTSNEQAVRSLQRARELAMGRLEYAIMEAEALANDGQFARARDVLGPLMSSRVAPDIRVRARSLMGRVVARERARAESAEPEAGQSSRDRPVLQNAGVGTATDSPSTEPGVIYEYRVLQPGEQRVEGTLERIECSATGVFMHLRTADFSRRFPAPALDAVQFISYRRDLVGAVSCGARNPPDRVYLTHRPDVAAGSGSIGLVVAVEFLPR
jgi:hypothetical protein